MLTVIPIRMSIQDTCLLLVKNVPMVLFHLFVVGDVARAVHVGWVGPPVRPSGESALNVLTDAASQTYVKLVAVVVRIGPFPAVSIIFCTTYKLNHTLKNYKMSNTLTS